MASQSKAVAIRQPTLGDFYDRLHTARSFAMGIEEALVGAQEIDDDKCVNVRTLLQAHQVNLQSIMDDMSTAMKSHEQVRS